MIILFIKFIIKLLFVTLWASNSYAQVDGTPNGAANITEKKFMFYIVQTGVTPLQSRRLATFVDSTKFIIGVPVYFDSMYRTESSGNPESLVWVRNSDNRFVWSLKDSLRIPYSQITSTPNIVVPTNLSGTPISITKWATGIVSPNTGNGYSIDISGIGLTNLIDYSIEVIKNTAVVTSVPKCAVKSTSNTAIVVNIIEGNPTLVTILGISVTQGLATQFANVTGLTLKITVWGN